MSCELESFYHHRGQGVPSADSAVERRRRFLDLQRVTDSSAKGTFALVEKFLASVSCCTFTQAREDSKNIDDTFIRLFMVAGDGGPDQVGSISLMQAVLLKAPRHLLVPSRCSQHCEQLVVKDGLVAIDRWASDHNIGFRYFGSVAKITLVWREAARSVYLAWEAAFGVKSALDHALRLPPKAIAGRWNSVCRTESNLLLAGATLGFCCATPSLRDKRRTTVRQCVFAAPSW
jgi:hypothetical protein